MIHPLKMELYNDAFFQKGVLNLLSREKKHRKQIMELLKPHAHEHILDIGCNGGRLVHHLRNYAHKVVGIDVNKAAVKKSRIPGLHIMSADDLEFDDNTFDKIVSSHTIEHIPHLKKAFEEIERVLKPGGQCVLIYPFEIIRGMNNFIPTWITYGNPFMSRKLHLRKLNPDKLDKYTTMKTIKSGMFLGPYPTYYSVMENN